VRLGRYRLGSWKARFAAADVLQEALGAMRAGVDLGDDGTLTTEEKCWIFDKFYDRYWRPPTKAQRKGRKMPSRPTAADVENLVARHRGANFFVLCEGMKRKYGASPLELWEEEMGPVETRRRELNHEAELCDRNDAKFRERRDMAGASAQRVALSEREHAQWLSEIEAAFATIMKLADAAVDSAGTDGGGDRDLPVGGRLSNLRFHLQPFCAIWSVEGVPPDDSISVEPGERRRWAHHGISYAVEGTGTGTAPSPGAGSRPVMPSNGPTSNVFSEMESCDLGLLSFDRGLGKT
jgi:hypothetical protein